MDQAEIDSEGILAETIEIASIAAPPFHEGARGDEVERRMRQIEGWRVRRDSVGNVIAELGDSPQAAVWAVAHLDTVFAAEQELRFERHGDIATGPGIGDNSLGVAALLILARQLPGQPLKSPVVFAFSVGEEGLGDLRGVREMLADGECRSAAAVIAVEGHGADKITTAAVGSLRYRGTAQGEGGHSWGDRGRPSALHTLIDFSHQIMGMQVEIGGDLSVNIGTLSGGSYVTAIAADAELTFEARSTAEESLRRFEDRVTLAAADAALPVSLEEVGRRAAGTVSPENSLVMAAQEARLQEGLEPAPFVAKSTDANAFIAAGIPAISVGLTLGRNSHHPSEEIQVTPIKSGVSALRRLILSLAS